jgi:DNA-binding CsgD family transcriptional regulator/ArsR family metal-binding transcriptional regulator
MLVQGYSDVSISKSDICKDLDREINYGAHFRLGADVSELFPYINGYIKKARYHYRPLHVQFIRESVLCTLYPKEAMAAPFKGRKQVFEFIEGLLVFLNDLHDRRQELKPSHKLYRQPPSIVDILKTLPQTNCGQCGYPTCMAFAADLRKGRAAPDHCPEFAQPVSMCAVYPVFGRDGAITSTFSIETENNVGQPKPQQRENKTLETDPLSEASNRKTSFYDRFGIRIQYDLTPREIQVLRLVAEGASNPEISQRLDISPHTVKSHVIHIFNKLNVNDRTQAAVWAARNRIV